MARARANTGGARKPLCANITHAEVHRKPLRPNITWGIKVYEPAPLHLRRDLCISMSTSWLA
jgi:hypothetical protein